MLQSKLNGIAHYEWAVGTKPGMENVQPFTQNGIVLGDKTENSGPGMWDVIDYPIDFYINW